VKKNPDQVLTLLFEETVLGYKRFRSTFALVTYTSACT